MKRSKIFSAKLVACVSALAFCHSALGQEAMIQDVKGIVVFPDTKVVYEGISPSTLANPVDVRGPDFLKTKRFEKLISKYLGKPFGEAEMKQLQLDIIEHCRNQGHFLVDVAYTPEVDITDGVVQIVVVEGKVKDIRIKNDGRRYVSDAKVLASLGLQQGAPVISGPLNSGLRTLNRDSSFREVTPRLTQGDELGAVNAEVEVKDRFPLRPFIGFDTYGTRLLGEERMNAGVTWHNAFWLDHELTYQFTTDRDVHHFKSHSVQYSAPLGYLDHSIVLAGAFTQVDADFEAAGLPATFSQSKGDNIYGSARYVAPLPKIGAFEHHLRAGFDFKRLDNQFEFATFQFTSGRPQDVDQFALGYHFDLPDPVGYTSAEAEGFYSPGDLSNYNNKSDLNGGNAGGTTKDHYQYLRVRAERVVKLPFSRDWLARKVDQAWSMSAAATWQASADNLPITEQLIIGGVTSVRGYPERFIPGDKGWFGNLELRTPVFRHFPSLKENIPAVQFFGFFDYGKVTTRSSHTPFDPVAGPESELYSAGAGFLFGLSRHLSARVDSAYPLGDRPLLRGKGEGRDLLTQFTVQIAF